MLQTGQLEGGHLGQKSARIRCRLGFAGYDVRSRAYVDRSELAFELQELIPSGCWMLGGQNGLQSGQMKPWKQPL